MGEDEKKKSGNLTGWFPSWESLARRMGKIAEVQFNQGSTVMNLI
jgi:hypothetical protein